MYRKDLIINLLSEHSKTSTFNRLLDELLDKFFYCLKVILVNVIAEQACVPELLGAMLAEK